MNTDELIEILNKLNNTFIESCYDLKINIGRNLLELDLGRLFDFLDYFNYRVKCLDIKFNFDYLSEDCLILKAEGNTEYLFLIIEPDGHYFYTEPIQKPNIGGI